MPVTEIFADLTYLWKLKFRQILALCDFSVAEYPSPRKLKLRQILALCDFSVAEYPPPPENWNFRQILALCGFFSCRLPPLAHPTPHPPNFKIIWNYGRSSQWESMCAKLPHVETLSNPDNYNAKSSIEPEIFGIFQITRLMRTPHFARVSEPETYCYPYIWPFQFVVFFAGKNHHKCCAEQ